MSNHTVVTLTKALVALLLIGGVASCGGGGSGDDEFIHTHPEGGEGVARLSWTPPLTRVNGQSLKMAELTGYEVWYANAPEQGPDLRVVAEWSFTIPAGHITEAGIDGLPEGLWVFSIRVLDGDGLVSAWSDIVGKCVGACGSEGDLIIPDH